MSRLQQEKPKAIDPLDYEAVISKLGDELKEDPLRDLLLFPDNDFLVSVWDRAGGDPLATTFQDISWLLQKVFLAANCKLMQSRD